MEESLHPRDPHPSDPHLSGLHTLNYLDTRNKHMNNKFFDMNNESIDMIEKFIVIWVVTLDDDDDDDFSLLFALKGHVEPAGNPVGFKGAAS